MKRVLALLSMAVLIGLLSNPNRVAASSLPHRTVFLSGSSGTFNVTTSTGSIDQCYFEADQPYIEAVNANGEPILVQGLAWLNCYGEDLVVNLTGCLGEPDLAISGQWDPYGCEQNDPQQTPSYESAQPTDVCSATDRNVTLGIATFPQEELTVQFGSAEVDWACSVPLAIN